MSFSVLLDKIDLKNVKIWQNEIWYEFWIVLIKILFIFWIIKIKLKDELKEIIELNNWIKCWNVVS
jgi:hypothetical protein